MYRRFDSSNAYLCWSFVMEFKDNLIKNLKETRLITGNGYDLFCGLKTKYSDFFNYRNFKSLINEWKLSFNGNVISYTNLSSPSVNREELWVKPEHFSELNFWDFFFYFASENSFKNMDSWQWCDVELVMAEWLSDSATKKGIGFPLIYELCSGCKLSNEPLESVYYLASVIIRKNRNKKFEDKAKFYDFLLSELKEFEHIFGKYITMQQSYDGGYNAKPMFSTCSKRALQRLCNTNCLASIDTFNFGLLGVKELEDLVHHINGDTEYPIFGVDSDLFLAPDSRYIFTKTSRRMELDMKRDDSEELKTCENVIVFGCSLASSDYSYFFSIFDKLDITNIDNNHKIIFAYNIYDTEKSDQIKATLMKSIFNLFQEYSRYKGNEKHPNRLLDFLTVQGKIVLFEI